MSRGFIGADVKAAIDAPGAVDINSPALVSPCFPLTNEASLQLEFVAGVTDDGGLLWERFNVADSFIEVRRRRRVLNVPRGGRGDGKRC